MRPTGRIPSSVGWWTSERGVLAARMLATRMSRILATRTLTTRRLTTALVL
jgi:hypothetical protein